MGIHRAPTLLAVTLTLVLPFVLSTPALPASSARTRITRAADLPRLYFRGPGNTDDLTASAEAFAPLAAAVRAHIEALLTDYEIQDRTTLKNLHTTLAHLSLLEGKDDEVLDHVAEARQLEEKPDERLLGITFYSEAIARARREARSGSGDEYVSALRGYLWRYLDPLPWSEVRQILARDRALLDLTTEHVIPAWIRTPLAPEEKYNGGTIISLGLADRLIFERLLLTLILPVKSNFMEAFDNYSGAHQIYDPKATRVNIWRSRSATLAPDPRLTPVVVAIWDSGIDTSIFPGQLYVNAREKPNGKDNDKNGFVSDVNGIGFRYDGTPTPQLFSPIDDADKRILSREREMSRGTADFYSGVDSPEARAYKESVSDVAGDSPDLDEVDRRLRNHAHGTEVADIAIAGNPAARLLVVRQSFRPERGATPDRDGQWWLKFALNAYSVVAYCKAHGVRVVNMSWILSPPVMAVTPGSSGLELDEGARAARECFAIAKRGLTLAIQSAPEILFVAAAGNTNQDATFSEGIPPSLELPNLVCVGAVDQAGGATDFTSFGKTVALYANGKSIETRIPGGETMTVSGTSLAAPQVTNLAAKLFALEPSLKVAEVIELIRKGASKSPDGRISLIHPKRSTVLLAIRNDKKRGL